MGKITVVGGGLAGLVAAIGCAEGGAKVTLYEARSHLGGKARTAPGPFGANMGPHVIYDDGASWAWLAKRDLVGSEPRSPLRGIRFHYQGKLRRLPPAALVGLLTARRERAPQDQDFLGWATERWSPQTARMLANGAGVFTFDHDPGRLSAAFVWERLTRVFAPKPPGARYIVGGWGSLVSRLADRAREMGVDVLTNTKVDDLPESPVILATGLGTARRLLSDDGLIWEGTRTALLDIGLVARKGDPFIVWDLDASAWVERFSAPDPSVAADGHSLLQAQVGLRPGEMLDKGVSRLEELLDAGYPAWRDREVWRRRSAVTDSSGALDLPGRSWQDRPAVAHGNGVFLAGDMVAAPGLLSEVSFVSAAQAAKGALVHAATHPTNIAL